MSIQAAALYALVGVTGAQNSVRDLQSVSNQANKTQGTLNQLTKNATQVGGGMLKVGQGLLRVAEVAGAAALVATGAAAKIGTSFQAQTELIHTQANASQAEVDRMRVAIQGMVHDVGTAPVELAKGLYHIESVGVRGAEALDVLKASALGAKLGLADMESVANALTAVKFSGIGGVKDMIGAMATMDAIIGQGNMRMQDLVDSFSTGILGTSKTFGIGLRDMGAALAVLTDAGVPAQVAATRIQMGFTHMAAPVPGAIKVLKRLGMTQFEMAADLRKPDGIFLALDDLRTHLEKAKEGYMGLDAAGQPAFITTPQGAADISKLFGGSRFGAAVMQLLGMVDRVKIKYDAIGNSQATFGEKVQATMKTAGFVWGQFRADVEESALAFSDGFLPALARAGSKLDAFLIGHQADIRRMGVDLGAWLDKINWTQVEDGANSFLGVLRTIVETIAKFPPQIDAAIVGFLALNKVSGGIIGRGVEDIAGGVLGGLGTIGKAGLRAVLSKVPVVGGAAAALTSTPVFVTNWPIGFGLPGGLPGVGAGAAAAGAAGGLGVGALAATVALATAPVAIAAYQQMYGTRDPALKDWVGGGGKWTRRETLGLPSMSPDLIQGDFDSAALHNIGAGVRTTTPEDRGLDSGALHSMTSQMVNIMSRVGDRQDRVLDQLHKDFLEAIGGLRKKDQTPAEVQRLAKELAAAVTKGVGNAEHTKEGLALLRAQLKNADPATARVLRQAIAIIAGKLPNREFVARQIAAADRIFHSGESTKQKISDLTRIQRSLLDHGDTKAAAKITAEIREEKRALKAATAAGAEATAEAIRAKDTSVAFNSFIKLVVDGLTISQAQTSATQFVRNAQRP